MCRGCADASTKKGRCTQTQIHLDARTPSRMCAWSHVTAFPQTIIIPGNVFFSTPPTHQPPLSKFSIDGLWRRRWWRRSGDIDHGGGKRERTGETHSSLRAETRGGKGCIVRKWPNEKRTRSPHNNRLPRENFDSKLSCCLLPIGRFLGWKNNHQDQNVCWSETRRISQINGT